MAVAKYPIVRSTDLPDPYVPVDGTMNVTGDLSPSGNIPLADFSTIYWGASGNGHIRRWSAQGLQMAASALDSGPNIIISNSGAGIDLQPLATYGVRIETSGSKAAPDSTQRGSIFYEAGGAGVADVFYVCTKSAADEYAWRDIAAGLTSAFAAKTTNYTVTDADYTLTGDPTGASFTFTLPTAVGRAGKRFLFKKLTASANTITIDGAGAETIDGAATLVIGTQNTTREIQSDGANWIVYGGLGAL